MISILSEKEIESLLMSAMHAHLGCHADGKTYVVPISFAYDGKRIIGYTSAGDKVTMMRKNPEVCIQVEVIESLTEWKSAVVWGRYEELHGSQAAIAVGYLIDRYGPIFADNPSPNRRGREITPPRIDGGIGERIVYCVNITERAGRTEHI
ncbi:MAG: pyridoxamine 5'-phosphate oxidase family protein [Fimbriimonadaceae bacterium]